MAHRRSNRILFFLFLACLILSGNLTAQAEMQDYPAVKLQSLDKTTARTMDFEARVGSTVKYGPLFIKVQACRKAPPIEQPESAAFLQIWEMTPEDKAKWVFSGWMFASSPALSPMDHPIYDVWVIDCVGELPAEEGAVPSETGSDHQGKAEQNTDIGGKDGLQTKSPDSEAEAGNTDLPAEEE